jgi:hypothetical protein
MKEYSDDGRAKVMGNIRENHIGLHLPGLFLYSSSTIFVMKAPDEDKGCGGNGTRRGGRFRSSQIARSPDQFTDTLLEHSKVLYGNLQ